MHILSGLRASHVWKTISTSDKRMCFQVKSHQGHFSLGCNTWRLCLYVYVWSADLPANQDILQECLEGLNIGPEPGKNQLC